MYKSCQFVSACVNICGVLVDSLGSGLNSVFFYLDFAVLSYVSLELKFSVVSIELLFSIDVIL